MTMEGWLGWVTVAFGFLLVLFADFLPLPLGGYDSQRMFLVVVLVAVLSITLPLLGWRKPTEVVRQSWPGLLVAITFILLPVFSATVTPYFWVEPGMYALFFLGTIIAGSVIALKSAESYWVDVLVTVGFAFAFFYGALSIVIYVYAMLDNVPELSAYIPWGFINIRYWSHVATWLLPLMPLGVLVVPLKNQRLWRALVAFTAAIWWWLVLVSMSRGTMFGLTFGTLLVLLLFGQSAKPWALVFFKHLALGVLAWLLLSVLVPSLLSGDIQARGINATSSGRMPLWGEAWAMSVQHFPFGAGPQAWLTHDVLTEPFRNSTRFGHPHNMYLMWAAEYGWLMVFALFVMGAAGFTRLWKKRTALMASADPSLTILAAFAASVAAALVHAGVSAVFIAPASMLVGLCVLSIFWALVYSGTRKAGINEVVHGSTRRTVVPVILCIFTLVGCGLWAKEVWHYEQAMEADLPYFEDHVPAGIMPRFWLQGYFPRAAELMPPMELKSSPRQ